METIGDTATDLPQPTPYTPGPDAVDIMAAQDGGVLKEIIRKGEGEDHPVTSDTVYVHYVGTLAADGSKFDSSRDRHQQSEFTLGTGAVIKAWDLGVATMLRGEVAVFQCKAEYAYGEKGSPPKIPPGATLVFEVELFHWKGEDVSEEKDGSIRKSVLTAGEGYKQPQEMTTCKVHLIGRYEGKLFQDEELNFIVGEVFNEEVVPGVEMAVKELKKGEKSRFQVAAKHAYGSQGHSAFNIPANADLEYEIELVEMLDPVDSWALSENKDKLAESEVAKAKGTTMFMAGRYVVALRYYKRVVELISVEDSMEGEEGEQRKKLLLASHLNSAMCHLKMNNDDDAIEACDDALKFDANSEKALFRRGTAHMNKRNYEQAAADFRATIKVDPNNKPARNNLATVLNTVRDMKEKEKKTYKGMFEKFAEQDTKKDKPIHVWKDKENEPEKNDADVAEKIETDHGVPAETTSVDA